MKRFPTFKHLLSTLIQRLVGSCPAIEGPRREVHTNRLAVSASKSNELVRGQPVEFFGGPFDGHIKHFGVTPSSAGETLAIIPVNRDTIARLENAAPEHRSVPTSNAVYELAYDDSRWGFYFVRQFAAPGSGQDVNGS